MCLIYLFSRTKLPDLISDLLNIPLQYFLKVNEPGNITLCMFFLQIEKYLKNYTCVRHQENVSGI